MQMIATVTRSSANFLFKQEMVYISLNEHKVMIVFPTINKISSEQRVRLRIHFYYDGTVCIWQQTKATIQLVHCHEKSWSRTRHTPLSVTQTPSLQTNRNKKLITHSILKLANHSPRRGGHVVTDCVCKMVKCEMIGCTVIDFSMLTISNLV